MHADDEVTIPNRLLPRWMNGTGGEQIPTERLRLRMAAYIYGNILVLAAIVLATGKSIVGGEAAILVAATTLTTYFAHILSHGVGQQLGRELHGHRPHMMNEVRDALPILISGIVPTVILFVAAFSFVPTQAAQVLAAVWVVGRIALIGFIVERLSGRTPTWRTLSGGLALALACAVVVVLKVFFAH